MFRHQWEYNASVANRAMEAAKCHERRRKQDVVAALVDALADGIAAAMGAHPDVFAAFPRVDPRRIAEAAASAITGR